jgi:hypothetical protein
MGLYPLNPKQIWVPPIDNNLTEAHSGMTTFSFKIEASSQSAAQPIFTVKKLCDLFTFGSKIHGLRRVPFGI